MEAFGTLSAGVWIAIAGLAIFAILILFLALTKKK
jgi:hypothetical protein